MQNIDGINFLFIKKANIYFVVTTKFNVSPSFTLELLERLARVFKDYCGVLSEESIRKNFILLYELLDEMIVSRQDADDARAAGGEWEEGGRNPGGGRGPREGKRWMAACRAAHA